jgi:ribonuclease R
MYDKKLAEQVKNLLDNNPSNKYRLKDLYKILHVRKHKHRDLRDTLFGMVKDQDIKLLGKKYCSSKKAGKRYLIGKFDARPLARGKSFAFLINEETDVFISAEDTLNAYDGDTIKVEVRSGRRDRLYGIVVKVLERNRVNFVGNVLQYGKKIFLQPDNSRVHTSFNLTHLQQAVAGDKVVVKITNWGNRAKHVLPSGEVIEILGKAGDPEVEVLSVIKHFDLPLEFPEKVISEVETISAELPEKEIARRHDFRDLVTFTIDPVSAKDYDDAISFEKTETGYELYVHIADVAHYVQPGSEIFAEAFQRGNSYYFPKMVIPMLPTKLSNNICSLRPDEDKFVMTVRTKFDKNFKLVSQDIYNAVICSDRRFSYEEIDEFFAGDSSAIEPDIATRLQQLLQLSQQLSEKRYAKGYLHFDLPETEYIFDDDGHVVDLQRSKETASHKLVENCMLIANEYTAKLLSSHHTIYRIHEAPTEEKINNLADTLARSNIKFELGKNINKALQKLLENLPSHDHHRVFDKMILRSMQKAKYSTQNKGHFGLAMSNYTHFTSPIRRLCDLIIHHQLKDHLQMRQTSFAKKELWKIAEQASEKEMVADDSEREVDQKNKLLFMKKHLGEEFTAIVIGLKQNALIVELDRYPVTGLVEFDSIADDYLSFKQDQMVVVAQNSGKKYRLTDKVQVFVNKVDDDIFLGFAKK